MGIRTAVHEISGILSQTGGEGYHAADGAAGKIVRIMNGIRIVAYTCGILAALCAVMWTVIMLTTALHPAERIRLKDRLTAVAAGCILLGAVAVLCAAAADIGSSLF